MTRSWEASDGLWSRETVAVDGTKDAHSGSTNFFGEVHETMTT